MPSHCSEIIKIHIDSFSLIRFNMTRVRFETMKTSKFYVRNHLGAASVPKTKEAKSWWHHQMETFSASLAICAGNSPVPGEFPTQRPVTRNFEFSLICVWINGWINNGEAGDLRHYRAHYDVIIMWLQWYCGMIWTLGKVSTRTNIFLPYVSIEIFDT